MHRPGSFSPRRSAVAILAFLWALAAVSTALEAGEGKVSGRLRRARDLALAGESAAAMAKALPSLELRDGRADVEIKLSHLGPDLVEALRARGLEIDSFHYGYARAYGRLDPARVDEIAALPEVRLVRRKPRAGRRVGSASSQADVTMKTFDVRSALGYTGTGVEVGILSDSFLKGGSNGGSVSAGSCACSSPGSSCTTAATGMANQTSGDLPASIPILDDCSFMIPECSPSALIDEGAAMAELVWDAAPGTGFLFHSAFNSPADFAEGIGELVNCGADVVVDDVFWTEQPVFQDGVIAAAAQDAVDGGTPYFSAAGNDGPFGYHDNFDDSDPANDDAGSPSSMGQDLHDFDPLPGSMQIDRFAAITIPDDCDIHAELHWNEPVGASASDLDFYLLSTATPPIAQAGGNVLDAGIDDQGCGDAGPPSGDPLEFVEYTNNTGSSDTVYLAIEHVCGDESVDMRIVNISFFCSFTDDFGDNDPATGYDFEDGIDFLNGEPSADGSETPILNDEQIFGHPSARGVVAVAASYYHEIDLGGTFDPPATWIDVELFSSLGGPQAYYYDKNGNPISETRQKPELTAPDGVNTTFFGMDAPEDDDPPPGAGGEDPNFFGTSAAAPNAAAVAALVLETTNQLINPLAAREMLRQAALDIETPGDDDFSGAGTIDAERTVRSLESTMVPLIADLEVHLEGTDFLKMEPTPLQDLRAVTSITLGDGGFGGLCVTAPTAIFTDGFESGNAFKAGH